MVPPNAHGLSPTAPAHRRKGTLTGPASYDLCFAVLTKSGPIMSRVLGSVFELRWLGLGSTTQPPKPSGPCNFDPKPAQKRAKVSLLHWCAVDIEEP